jgi:hypothetical protein
MPEIEVNIELYCETCGAGICGLGTATKTRGQACFRIEACDKCVSNADDAGYKRGYDEGYQAARERYESDL